MALARSASGPGSLSINTGSANSLFGSSSAQPATSGGILGAPTSQTSAGMFGTSQAQSSGGLFGASTAASQPQQTGGLFGSTPAPQPAQSGGLFGGSTATTQPQQSGGLFGAANTTASSQPQQSGGLFGGANNTSQPQQSAGLFGNMNTTSQPQQSGGLFGGANNASQTQQSGGLFGGNSQATSNQQGSGSLFGALAPTSQPAQSGGLFSLASKPTANSFFGATQAKPTSTPFGGSTLGGGLTMGQQNQQAQPSVPGVRIDWSQIRTTSRFNDLHESVQNDIEQLDKFILAQIQLCNECTAIMPSHNDQLSLIPTDVDLITRKLSGVKAAAADDVEAIQMVGKSTGEDIENARLSFQAIDILKLPAQYHHQGLWNGNDGASREGAQDLVTFFSRTADDMSQTLSRYQRLYGEIETHMRGVEASSFQQVAQIGGADQQEQMRELSLVLREFEQGIVGVAGTVGSAREGLQRLQLGGFLESDARDRRNGNGKRGGVY